MTSAFLNRVVELTNIERAQQGLAPLTFNPQLAAAAQVHSANMGMRDFLDHTRSFRWHDRSQSRYESRV